MSLLKMLARVGALGDGDGESRQVVDGWARGLGGRADGGKGGFVACG